RGVGVAVEQRFGRHQHSRRAIAALGGKAVHEGLLQRVKVGAAGKAGGGGDLAALDGFGEGEARQMRRAVDQHGAGAAGTLATAVFRSEVPYPAAQNVEQVLAVLDEERLLGAVKAELERLAGHGHLRSAARSRPRWTPTTSRRYQAEASASVRGSIPSQARRAASAIVAASRLRPSSARSAAVARIGVVVIAAYAMRAPWMRPPESGM